MRLCEETSADMERGIERRGMRAKSLSRALHITLGLLSKHHLVSVHLKAFMCKWEREGCRWHTSACPVSGWVD